MTTFSVEINEDIVIRLKGSDYPEITLDLPSVPVAGDKLWVKSMRGSHIVETDKCLILESESVSRLRPTVRLVLLFGIATDQGHAESVDPSNFRAERKHASLSEIIRNARAEHARKDLLQARIKMDRRVDLVSKLGKVTSDHGGHSSITAKNDHTAAEGSDKNSGGSDKK
ncbi:MAG: hypothetical protein E7I42_11550 [Pluralibacter gergoviae]|nr:hypothetical protein [Pluralibacter gergoviae]